MRAKYPITALVLAVIAGCNSKPQTDNAMNVEENLGTENMGPPETNAPEMNAADMDSTTNASEADNDVLAPPPPPPPKKGHGK